MAGNAVMEFFRFCPECGRRFRIKLVDKKLIAEHKEQSPDEGFTMGATPLHHGSVQDSGPMIFDIKEFQYEYKCQHCGHEWSEKHVKDDRIN
jgi:hypothetical protein